MARLFVGRLNPPASDVPFLERPRLHARLEAAMTRQVCSVYAARGWGKSAALAQWIARDDGGLAVVSDASVQEIRRLVGTLLEARDTHPWSAPYSAREVFTCVGDAEKTSLERAWETALSGASYDQVVLLLDDATEILRDAELAALVQQLCRRAPTWLRIVLVPTRELPFPLNDLRIQGKAVEIDAGQLAFDQSEVGQLAICRGHTELLDLTGGWPAAVLQAVRTLQERQDRDHQSVAELIRLGTPMSELLGSDFFADDPVELRGLLGRMAALGKVTRSLCAALGFADVAGYLPELVRRGIARYDAVGDGTWSLNPVIAEFLRTELSLSANERAALQRKAGDVLTADGAYAQALQHYVAANDRTAIEAILVAHGTVLVETGHAQAVVNAGREFPAYGHTLVHGIVGYARQIRGQWSQAMEAFQQAISGPGELEAGLAWRMGMVPYASGEFVSALELYGRARLDREDTRDEALLLAWTAAAYHAIGDTRRCAETLLRAEAAAQRCHDPGAWASVCRVRATAAAASGDRRVIEGYFAAALQWSEVAGDTLQVLHIVANRAQYLLELGLLRPCIEQVDRALGLNDTCGHAVLHASTLTTRGLAYVKQARYDAAQNDLRAACETFQAIGSRLLAWPLVGIGLAHSVRGELAQARAAYEEALALAEPNHEVLGLGHVLTGLARVRAADDMDVATDFAERAVLLGESGPQVAALLTRGWLFLLRGETDAAHADVTQAASLSRVRRNREGLAEALELSAFLSSSASESEALFNEAAQIWAELGFVVEEHRSRLAAARVVGPRGRMAAEAAQSGLAQHGIRLDAPHAAGAFAVMARSLPAVSIRAMGVFQISCNGTPLPASAWQSRMARDLVKILVAHRGGPVSRERLMELLWPEEVPAKASKRLSVLLSTVRSVLESAQPGGDGVVVTDRGVVWLKLDQVTVDVEEFMSAAAAALEQHERGERDATGALIAAEARYSGEFLADDPYPEWAEPLREEARALYASVLRVLAARLRAAGDVDGVLRYTLRLLLHLDPYDEQAHITLVDTLLDAGRRGEARRRYDDYLRRMGELGVSPVAWRSAVSGELPNQPLAQR